MSYPLPVQRFLLVAVALALGIVLGAWQPRNELRELRAEADALRAELARSGRGQAISGVQSLLQDGLTHRERPEPTPKDAPSEAAPEAPDPTDEAAAPPEEALPEEAPADLAQTQAAMEEMLEARRAQALAALTEQADLDEQQTAQVEALMDEMNAAMRSHVDGFVQQVLSQGDVERHDMLVVAADMLDTVIVTDEKMQALLGDELYDSVDPEAVDPLSYVDGSTLSSLAQLQGMDMPDF